MRAIAFAACVALGSGCVSYRSSQVTAIAGGAALVTGLVAGALDGNSGESDGHAITNAEATAMILVPLGVVLALTGLMGMGAHAPPPTKPTSRDRASTSR